MTWREYCSDRKLLILYVHAPECKDSENTNLFLTVISNVMEHLCYWIFDCETNLCNNIFSLTLMKLALGG